METIKTIFQTVDEYIDSFPKNVRDKLTKLRRCIRQNAPEAVELISYNMPAFKLKRILVYYAAHKEHIGLYPMSSAITVFRDQLADYKTSKGTIQFPLDKEIPEELVRKIVQFRVKENAAVKARIIHK